MRSQITGTVALAGDPNNDSTFALLSRQAICTRGSEPGLYQLELCRVRQDQKRQRSWVFEEVLPSIQKTGGYEIQALKDEMMQEHAEEISKAMEQLSIKNTQIAAKDEELAIKDQALTLKEQQLKKVQRRLRNP